MNENLYVITASGPVPKEHVEHTIKNSIPPEKVEPYFFDDELKQVQKIGREHGYYAWGAVPGIRNIPNWESMKKGDQVLIYQNKMYTFVAKVALKDQNRDFALTNWNQDAEGNTWEYMYLLEKPTKLDTPIPAVSLKDYLPSSYRGFTRIVDPSISATCT